MRKIILLGSMLGIALTLSAPLAEAQPYGPPGYHHHYRHWHHHHFHHGYPR